MYLYIVNSKRANVIMFRAVILSQSTIKIWIKNAKNTQLAIKNTSAPKAKLINFG